MTKNRERTTRISYVIEAGFEYFISLFVTSTFLGYILDALGFSDAMQGIISTVATFTCGAQLFALALVGRKVKRIVTVGHLINQLCFVLLYLLPLFELPPAVKTAALLVLLFAGHIINNAVNPAKITWLMSTVPNSRRGSFTAVKEMISLAGGMAVSVGLGAIADAFRDSSGLPTPTYYRICFVALLSMMIIHTVTLVVAEEKPLPHVEQMPIKRVLSRMVSNRNLLKVIGVGVLWNLASGLSVSFLASYLREELAFSFTLITVMSVAGSLFRIMASPLLGRMADKRSFSFSMTFSFFVVGAAFLLNSFAAPGATRWFYIGYICLHSFAMAGINSGVINLIYDYVIAEERAVALGIKNAIGGIVGFVAALGSGALLSRIQSSGGLRLFGVTLYAQQVLSFLSFTVVAVLILYMLFIIRPMKHVDGDDKYESAADDV